ncbi:MAG: beta-lactamase family protein [Thermoanaerobaculales bacterium]|jgi:CubicO group peptidase (beta-lactamase class C family)|nr:beta-lactamase family protein [Thermoanaerobaculales bacterium]
MFRTRRAMIVLLGVVLVAWPAVAQQRVWTETGDPVPGWEPYDAAIRDFMQTWAIPGAALAVAYEGRLVYARGFTWDSPEAEPVQPTSLFRIASMSKPITSVAIHQLIERGLLSHDTRVVDVLDLEPGPGGHRDPWLELVTVDHLLYHTGGLDRDQTFDPMFYDETIAAALGVELPISKRDIATYMSGRTLQSLPGLRFAYSNYGYCLLGLIIEEVTGRDYSEWVAENVFQPIGVGRPRRGHTALHERAPGEVRYHGWGEDPYRWNIENMDAHGGWILSAPDYLRFMGALFDDPAASPLLGRASIEAMLEVIPETASAAYGRGWVVIEDDGVVSYGHDGSLPGTITVGRWFDNGIAMVALLNTRKEMDDIELADPTTVPAHDLFESVGIAERALGAALAESWIPVVARSAGAGGSLWRSDLALLNRSSLANRLRLRVEMTNLAVDRELELEPGEQLILGDVVGELGLAGSGSLRVFSSEPLTVASRTYNLSPDGSFGQLLGGVTGPGGLGNGDRAVLMHLREDALARSNIGILNAGRREARVLVELLDGDGIELASFTRQVAPRRVLQLNQPILDQGGRSDVTTARAVVTVLDGEEVVVYGSVVDAGTNDPTTIPMKTGPGATSQWVAAAARDDGAAGSVWRTDLGLLNADAAEPASAIVTYHPAGGPDVSLELVLEAGEHRVLADVVGLLGSTGSGSLEVTADRPVLVSSRTYNLSAAGSFGQYLDGLDAARLVGDGDTVWLAQLQQNQDFRTNIGVLNTGPEQTVLRLELRDGAGAELATAQRTIPAGGRLQLQEPFRRIAGRTDIADGYAVVEVISGSGVAVYASVVDNRTNDPTTVPMVR